MAKQHNRRQRAHTTPVRREKRIPVQNRSLVKQDRSLQSRSATPVAKQGERRSESKPSVRGIVRRVAPREVVGYYVTVFPGIEKIASWEVSQVLGEKVLRTLPAHNNSLIFFDYQGNISKCRTIGTCEDVYVLLGEYFLTHRFQDLKTVSEILSGCHRFEFALAKHWEFHKKNKGKHRPTFRVIVQASGKYAYRRIDVQESVEKTIRRMFPLWRLVEDNADFEIWVHCIKDTVIFGLRLSDETMRHRTYKTAHIAASLRPTIARAMTLLSRISDTDIFCDPFCGAGTILIERAHAGRYVKLIGGDISAEALAAAHENVGTKYQPIELHQWDARKIPLPDASVHVIVSNLPFGKQISTPKANIELYHSFFREAVRVLSPGGRMVFLTSESRLVIQEVERTPQVEIVNRMRQIFVLGVSAEIIMITKRK